VLEKNFAHTGGVEVMSQIIDKQPTAYDIDKVVERLDKASDYYECDEQGRERVQMIDLADAIEIVRGEQE
jgi:hypothetical protein